MEIYYSGQGQWLEVHKMQGFIKKLHIKTVWNNITEPCHTTRHKSQFFYFNCFLNCIFSTLISCNCIWESLTHCYYNANVSEQAKRKENNRQATWHWHWAQYCVVFNHFNVLFCYAWWKRIFGRNFRVILAHREGEKWGRRIRKLNFKYS